MKRNEVPIGVSGSYMENSFDGVIVKEVIEM